MKILVALGQTLFAIATLYRTRGDQIAQFGYAAFGLTVTPYAFMSIINLVGNLMTPTYSTVFLVEPRAIQEAPDIVQYSLSASPLELNRQKAVAEGSLPARPVGRLTGDFVAEWEISRNISRSKRYSFLKTAGGSLVLASAILIGIVGGLSYFQLGSSTVLQRVWSMLWLTYSCSVGSLIEELKGRLEPRTNLNFSSRNWLTYATALIFYAVPAIGGFVVIGQMLLDYGVCIRIS
jgi:hypothetical protein